jgi:SAM-dependent methyltransferase
VLRRRLANLRHRHLYRVTREMRERAAGLTTRMDAVDQALALRAPMLWNDVGRAGVTPSTPASEALGEVDDAEFERVLSLFDGCLYGELLRASGLSGLRTAIADDELPLPPTEARERYFDSDPLAYWLSGYADRLMIARHAELSGATVLDFGGSSGRTLRHLHHAGAQVMGIDINVSAVAWARTHLPFPVLQGTVVPSLPLPDASIDVIFGASVFTHIDMFEEAWLAELRRVLRPGGKALLTFHPGRLWGEMQVDPGHLLRRIVERTPHTMDGGPVRFDGEMPSERVVFTATTYPVNNANVIHSQRWIRDMLWGRFFAVGEFVEGAHGDHQDLAILTRKV